MFTKVNGVGELAAFLAASVRFCQPLERFVRLFDSDVRLSPSPWIKVALVSPSRLLTTAEALSIADDVLENSIETLSNNIETSPLLAVVTDNTPPRS